MDDLLEYLAERVDFTVRKLSPAEVAVGVLGSFADGGETALAEYLAPWRDANPSAALELIAASDALDEALAVRARDLAERLTRDGG